MFFLHERQQRHLKFFRLQFSNVHPQNFPVWPKIIELEASFLASLAFWFSISKEAGCVFF